MPTSSSSERIAALELALERTRAVADQERRRAERLQLALTDAFRRAAVHRVIRPIIYLPHNTRGDGPSGNDHAEGLAP